MICHYSLLLFSGKAHQMVKVGTKKKRSKQQLEEVKAEEIEMKQVSYF